LIFCLIFLCGWSGPVFCVSGHPPGRIVSLAPAMTEILFSIGLGNRVVGVTNVCDRPAEARARVKIGGMSNPSIEAIVALKPDIVVMNTDGNPKAVADRLSGLGIRTYVFRAKRLNELPAGIREMGRVLGAAIAADSLAQKIETAVRHAGAQERRKSRMFTDRRRKALFVIWPSPLVVAGPGSLLDDAMKLKGWTNIVSDARAAYPQLSLETVLGRAPDLILIGNGHAGMKRIAGELLKKLNNLEAVRKGRVCYLDDALYRPGPRIPEGMAELDRCGEMR